MIKPDLFYALDASPANDASGDKTEFGQLGKGALLRIFDRTMVTHRGMREFVLDTAADQYIPINILCHKVAQMQVKFIFQMKAFQVLSLEFVQVHSYTCKYYPC